MAASARLGVDRAAEGLEPAMGCAHVGGAIVCGPRIKRCGRCSSLASRQCDWKVTARKTCDAWICDLCTTEPAPDKDLCRHHAEMWGERLSR